MSRKNDQQNAEGTDARLRAAFKVIIVLLTVVAALTLALVFSWRRSSPAGPQASLIMQLSPEDNLIRKKFPSVDFSAIYPGLSAADIDRLQRDCISLRYVYAPFVEFSPLPVSGRFVNITPAGYRQGRTVAPWPPAKDELVVFVFGGSTTFGYGLPDGQTVVSALEENLGRRFPGHTLRCYNFGRGYYFSAQERQLFQSLLGAGYVPDVAVFIDGLNDFIYYDGVPQLTPELLSFTAPDFPAPHRPELKTDAERTAAVDQMIYRYAQSVRQTEAVAGAYGVTALFIGQPVPFLDFTRQPSTYPFPSTYAEHELCGWGYGRFKAAAQAGRFGPRFLWCGDAFAQADRIMYADSIHYSPAGAEMLGRHIVEKIMQANLLPAR